MFRIRIIVPLLAGLLFTAQPAGWAASSGAGLLHVIVTTNTGAPASDAMVWITSQQVGHRRMAWRRAGEFGHTTFTIPAGAFTVHARGTGGHSAASGSFMVAGQERTMALSLHGNGGWWWLHGYRGIGPHIGTTFTRGRRFGLGARASHRTAATRRAARSTGAPGHTSSSARISAPAHGSPAVKAPAPGNIGPGH